MNLTIEQYQAVLKSIRLGSRGAHEERRRAPRASQRGRIEIILVDKINDPPTGASVRNFSSRGLNVLHRQPLKAGSQFVAVFARNDGPGIRILYTIVHCHPLPNHLYSLGAELTCVLDEQPPECFALDEAEVERIRKSILR